MKQSLCAIVLSVTAALTVIVRAQDADRARSAVAGTWLLHDANAGGEKVVEQVEVVPAGGAPTAGTGATDGAGTGVAGGRGGFVPTASDPNGRFPMLAWADWGKKLPSVKPKRLSPAEALRKEVSTPAEELLISVAKDSVTIGDGIWPSIPYATNDKTEAHQLVNGAIKTKTMWDGSVLRQDIDGGKDFEVRRTFELTESGELRVMFAPKAGWFSVEPMGSGSNTQPPSNARRSIYKRKAQ